MNFKVHLNNENLNPMSETTNSRTHESKHFVETKNICTNEFKYFHSIKSTIK